MHFIHDSHDTYYRNPFGAVEINSEVIIRCKVRCECKQNVELFIVRNDETCRHDMVAEGENNGYNIFSTKVVTPPNPSLVYYFFKITTEHIVKYYGNNEFFYGGKGELYDENVKLYQITVHKPNIKVPDWYKEGIMYQIFVDRFNISGEKDLYSNRKGFIKYTNWHEKNRYLKDEKGEIIFWDVYGGNIKGIIEKIEYLKNMGVSILYLNPIFEANSNHKYNTGDYEKIDEGYGDIRDFEELVKKCKKNNINIILDGVFSHVGSDSKYFNKYNNYDIVGGYQSKESKYYYWFNFEDYPDKYDCWWGHSTLPNVNELNSDYLDYIITGDNSVIKQWMRNGIKGWRLDVADELPDEFIQLLKKEMKKVDDDSILLGEVWEDASNKISYGELRKYFLGNELDSVMNYPLREIFIDYILNKNCGDITRKRLLSLYENYPKEYFYSCMNLLGSHDTIRIFTLMGNSPVEEDLTDDDKYYYKLDKYHYNLAVKRLKVLSLLQVTFPGVPCIYYGDEVGMEGYSDPYCRGTYPWGKEDKDLLEWYTKILNIRKDYNIFKKGIWEPYICRGSVFSFIRKYNEDIIYCFFNSSLIEDIKVSLPKGKYVDIINDCLINEDFTISSCSGYILQHLKTI